MSLSAHPAIRSSVNQTSSSRSLRAIAPVDKRTDEMPGAVDLYAASCNPPRRAKRPRSDSTTAPSADAQLSRASAKVTKQSQDSTSDNESADGNETSTIPAPPAARRGRKPGTLSRAAREAQRKMNHSLIEKARRTKINDALATLRVLVPSEYKRDDDDEYSGKKKKDEKEKEFKLEILIRTVAYLEELTAKVKILEEGVCPDCGRCTSEASVNAGVKRKRSEEIEETEVVNDSNASSIESERACEEFVKDAVKPARSVSGQPPPELGYSMSNNTAPRLPSISSWLSRPDISAGSASMLPSTLLSPTIRYIGTAESSTSHLPSPPLSSTIRAESNIPAPPALTLPSPDPFNVVPHPRSTLLPQPLSPPSSWTGTSKPSPTFSPIRTPEDESAASLLLQIRSSSSNSHSSSEEWRSVNTSIRNMRVPTMKAQTPSSLLGLAKK